MKNTVIILCLMIAVAGCRYKKDGKFVKDADGNIYKLERAAASESYFLNEVDTVEFKKLNRLP